MKQMIQYRLMACGLLLASGLWCTDDPKFSATDATIGTPEKAAKEMPRVFGPTKTAFLDLGKILPECAQAQMEGSKLQKEFEKERSAIEKQHKDIEEKVKKGELTNAEYTKEMNGLQIDAKELQEKFAVKFRELDENLKNSVEGAAEKVAKKYGLEAIQPKGIYAKEEFLVDDEVIDEMNKAYYAEKRTKERDAKFKKAAVPAEKPAAKPTKKAA